MLKRLLLENVGPAPRMELDLGSRLNIITGDNGLGKSFLLDVAWFVNTGSWPRDINSGIAGGYMARPNEGIGEGMFKRFYANPNESAPVRITEYRFDLLAQGWLPFENKYVERLFPTIYAMADGSVAIWDHYRNSNEESLFASNNKDRPKAFVFSSEELWKGKLDVNGKRQIQGLISDWASWQKENGDAIRLLASILTVLSPEHEQLKIGELTRIDVNDLQDVPTVIMSYGKEVPVVFAAAGIRRILSLAYILVWMWEEHRRAAKFYKQGPSNEITFLLDEVECHLHPSWQRKIVPALLEAVSELSKDLNIQLIATTHSPLVMASLEPHFDIKRDKWFDLDLVRKKGSKPKVVLTDRPFEKMGDSEDWLTSDAFDLNSTRSIEAEQVLEKASIALSDEEFDARKAKILYAELIKVLPADDLFWTRWNMIGKKKGWWK